MVTRYHDRDNAGFAALVYRRLYLGTDGVHHADKTYKGQSRFEGIGGGILRNIGVFLRCGGKDSQRLIRHSLVFRCRLFSDFIRHGYGFAVHQRKRAFVDDNIGRALRVLNYPAVHAVERGHHFSARVERGFPDARLGFAYFIFVDTRFCGECHERRLCRFAAYRAVRVQLCVRAKCRCLREKLPVAEKVRDGHFVLRERSGFVRAYDLRAAERFDRRQLSYHGVFL